jgi:hypothetical protein
MLTASDVLRILLDCVTSYERGESDRAELEIMLVQAAADGYEIAVTTARAALVTMIPPWS